MPSFYPSPDPVRSWRTPEHYVHNNGCTKHIKNQNVHRFIHSFKYELFILENNTYDNFLKISEQRSPSILPIVTYNFKSFKWVLYVISPPNSNDQLIENRCDVVIMIIIDKCFLSKSKSTLTRQDSQCLPFLMSPLFFRNNLYLDSKTLIILIISLSSGSNIWHA